MSTDLPWVKVKDVCVQYGWCYEVAKRKVRDGTFPVPTYLAGRISVIDRVVHETYFKNQREADLATMTSTLS